MWTKLWTCLPNQIPFKVIYRISQRFGKNISITSFFWNFLEDISPFGGHWWPYFGLLPWVSKPGWIPLLAYFVTSVSPLVWHLITSWWPVWQLNHFDPHICAQTLVGLSPGCSMLLPHGKWLDRRSTDWAKQTRLVVWTFCYFTGQHNR